jgi:hypothetical protein
MVVTFYISIEGCILSLPGANCSPAPGPRVQFGPGFLVRVLPWGVKRKTLKAHLLKAERQVAKGQALVDGQRQLLTSDFLKGEGITDEVELLKQLLEEQRLLIKHRDQLLKELAKHRGP